MKKNLKYLTDAYIDKVWAEQDTFFNLMNENRDNIDWLQDFCKEEPIVSSSYYFDFEFEMDDSNRNLADYHNAINLYNLFKGSGLKDATIYNEKFMSGFIFTFGYKYFFWEMDFDKKSKLFGPLFFENSGGLGQRRSIARNVVGRLYRTAETTIDESLEDKFELTKFVFENRALLRMYYHTHLDGEITRKGFILGFKKWKEETNGDITISLFDKVRKQVCAYGNINKIDILNKNDFADYVYNYIKKITNKEN